MALLVILLILVLFLVTPLWQAWPGAALAAFLYWLGAHLYAYPDGLPARIEGGLLLAVVVLAVNGVARGRRRDRIEQERRRLGKL